MTWTDRTIDNICARAGCTQPPSDDHNLCPTHRVDHNVRQRRSARERRWFRAHQLALPLSTSG